MRTRIVSIQIDEDQDGRKRTVRKSYPADAMLLLDPPTAGAGFLAIVQDLASQLDGAPVKTLAVPATTPTPEPPPPKPGAFAPGKHFSGTKPPPPVSQKEAWEAQQAKGKPGPNRKKPVDNTAPVNPAA